MSKRKAPQADRLSPPPSGSPPSATMTTAVARPTTPSSAVQIPVKPRQDAVYKQKSRHHGGAPRRHSSYRRQRDTHSPDAIPPSVAALLAITNIPPPNRRGSLRSRQTQESRMTVDSIVPRSRVSEKELSQELSLEFGQDLSFSSLDRSPMDILLSPPGEFDGDEASITSDGAFTSPVSTQIGSLDSVPSLGDSLGTSLYPSVGSPMTPRGRKARPPRRSLEPLLTPPGEMSEDPLSKRDSIEVDKLDFRVFDAKPAPTEEKQAAAGLPLKSVFKSNLTASLRALRSAARSLSTFTASSIPPDDFLTRSILTIDPRVPFTDERRPPVLEEEPSESMRRYLNPSNTMHPQSRQLPVVRVYTASIQMQTYKVSRSKGSQASSRHSSPPSNSNKSSTAYAFPPGPRQREMRENSDFIRIAVMEHLMRKRGKLDDQREGHARWLLPPRKATSGLYAIGTDGVPLRWVPTSQGAD
ncbi:hypothetical protein F4778DRAFT_771258 [Xylariomycetidae sp. FL2044]|nr:hypothetical protein F4778DRAFT_771258 [Xylariomycetidae sp. FL2044]